MSILSSLQDFNNQNPPNFDFHLHTNWTDGDNTVKEMVEAAVNANLTHILFSEHVRSTSGEWFSDFVNEVRKNQNDLCQSLVGMETKIINFQGDLDVNTAMLEQCDLVMASVHRFPGEEGIIDGESKQFKVSSLYDDPIEIEFELANRILENPEVDILGHPFGMSYKRFHLIPPEKKIVQLIQKAAKTGVAFEINSRYHPNLLELVKLCKKWGALISLGSNAHSIQEVGNIVRCLRSEAQYAIS